MEFVEPEEGVADQKVFYLGPAIVKNQRTPFPMGALARILVLVKGGAVKATQAVAVGGEVGGYPVEEYANARGVAAVHKGHEVLGCAVAAGGGIIAGYLITPGFVQGVFHDGQQFDMGKAHLLDIGDEVVGTFTIAQEAGRRGRIPLPRAKMHLVDRDRPFVGGRGPSLVQPFVILPGKGVQIVDQGSSFGPDFGKKLVGVGLLQDFHALGADFKLIGFGRFDSRNEKFPDARAAQAPHLVDPAVPVVEVTNDAYPTGRRRPHPEDRARHPAHGEQVGAQSGVDLVMGAVIEKILIEIA